MKNNKGFAISGMIYPILILAIFLIVELLVTLQSRKMILDRNKKDVLDGVNNEQIYKKYENGEVIYFNPETNQKCNSSDYKASNSLNENERGCMKWYAFNDTESSSTVNVILDHNTTYKVPWNSSGSNTGGMKEVQFALEEDIQTWNSSLKPRLIGANEIAKITGNTEFDATNPNKDNYFYLENNTQTKPTLSQGQAKYKWLFDYTSNCTGDGCSITDYNTDGYWTSTPYLSSSSDTWIVDNYGILRNNYVGIAPYHGVRPVITISKSILEQPVPTPKPTPTPTPNYPNLLDTIKNKNTSGNKEGLFQDMDGNIRYRGSNSVVKNYIKFNNENWRIIGIVDQKLKIIRNQPFESNMYHSDMQSNNWETSPIKIRLNESFYNSLSSVAKSQVEEVTYYLGGFGYSYDQFAKLTAADLYSVERGYDAFGSNPTRVNQKIGLMYPSDYAFAANAACKEGVGNYHENTPCTNDNWLYIKNAEWTISPTTTFGRYSTAIAIGSDYQAGSLYVTGTNESKYIRPVTYLKDSVKVKDGTGSQSDPYIIE